MSRVTSIRNQADVGDQALVENGVDGIAVRDGASRLSLQFGSLAHPTSLGQEHPTGDGYGTTR